MNTPVRAAIHVDWQGGRAWQCPFGRRELVAVLEVMRRACGLEGVSLGVTLADDAFVSRVNTAQLGCHGPTNILSFPAFGAAAEGGEAQLLLSLDTLERECLLYGQDPAEHTLRLFAHGMAHVGGLEHGAEMDAMQDAAFTAGMRAAGLLVEAAPVHAD